MLYDMQDAVLNFLHRSNRWRVHEIILKLIPKCFALATHPTGTHLQDMKCDVCSNKGNAVDNNGIY